MSWKQQKIPKQQNFHDAKKFRSPEDKFWRKLLFSPFVIFNLMSFWIWPWILKSSHEMKDVPPLPQNMTLKNFEKKIFKILSNLKNSKRIKDSKYLYILSIIICEWKRVICVTVITICYSLCISFMPFLLYNVFFSLKPKISLEKFLNFIESYAFVPKELQPDSTYDVLNYYRVTNNDFFVYSTLFLIVYIASRLLFSLNLKVCGQLTIISKMICLYILGRKNYKLSDKSRLKHSKGELCNLFSNDVIVIGAVWRSFIWIGEILYFIILPVYLSLLLSYTVIVNIIVFIIFAICEGYIVNGMITTLKKVKPKSDSRVKGIVEAISSIKFIKYFACEEFFIKKIYKKRNDEEKMYKSHYFYVALMVLLMILIPYAFSYSTFSTLIFFFRNIDPSMYLCCMLCYINVRRSIEAIHNVLVLVTSFDVGYNRFFKFISSEERESPVFKKERIKDEYFNIKIENGNYKYSSLNENSNLALKRINLKIKTGLTIISGDTGAGKSSLLRAINQELPMESGNFHINGKVSYAPQIPFIENKTIMENILFSTPLNEEKLSEVLKLCCLFDDLKHIKGGIKSEIGEAGANLSGGQKNRISLARSVYCDSDIYVIDDILSSFDTGIRKRIFEELIINYLKKRKRKTIVFATNQIEYLPYADQIILLKNGEIVEDCNFSDLMKKKEIDFIKNLSVKKKKEKKIEKMIKVDSYNIKNDVNSYIVQKDSKEKGAVSLFVYLRFFLKSNLCVIFGLLLLIFVYLFFLCGDFFLTLWSTGKLSTQMGNIYHSAWFYNSSNSTFDDAVFYKHGTACPGVVCKEKEIEIIWKMDWNNGTVLKEGMTHFLALDIYLLVFFCALLCVLFGQFFLTQSLLYGSTMMFKGAIKRVLYAPISFFEKNRIGRIASRFANDQRICDESIVFLFTSVFSVLFGVLLFYFGFFFIFQKWYFLVLSIFFLGCFLGYFLYVRNICVEYSRLTLISNSNIVSQVDEDTRGMKKTRCFIRDNGYFGEGIIPRSNMKEFKQKIYNSATVEYTNLNIQIFNMFVFEFCMFFILICCFLDIAFSFMDVDNYSFYCLCLIFCVVIVVSLRNFYEFLFELESNSICVERIDHYCHKIGQEDNNDRNTLKTIFPSKGEIIYDNFSFKYSHDLPLVLKSISFKINPGEKIGVVGKTGSGKSSIVASLFQMHVSNNEQLSSGKIFIDNVDISKVNVQFLRKNLAIITQNPVLFYGTIRENIDLFGEFNDLRIWKVLEYVGMKDVIEIKSGDRNVGLDTIVEYNGSNFSVGQRQLLCFARILIKTRKILVLDECGSSLDYETEKIISEGIKKYCVDCTVINIAHRIHFVCDSDRIMVVENGKIVEFDTPMNLMIMNKYSAFKKLVNESGEIVSKKIKEKIFGKAEFL